MPFLQRQRWFGGKARPLAAARFVDWATLRRGAHPAFLTIVEAEYRDGGRERYVAAAGDVQRRARPTPSSSSTRTAVLARITGARKGLLYDGLFDDGTCATLLAAMQRAARAARCGTDALQAPRTSDSTADRAPAEALTPIVAIRARPEQHVGAVRQAARHEDVPARRAGTESRCRDRRVPRRRAASAACRRCWASLSYARGGDDRPRSRCCRGSSRTRATAGR